ncbi:hypothetical protein CRG98_003315 [Punica granatum]|uniref:Uncharacterized protein n=1 Tax=Punica granatum TaxID=22663 RepID=A0A2I0L6N0_PUNGR|nr:hypothetical protein CRG98_003315 [Punica granatum]
MARAFNVRVRHREFNPGDLVLRKVLHVTPDSRGKFSYKYDGPFVVKETFSRGAVILSDMDGTENALPESNKWHFTSPEYNFDSGRSNPPLQHRMMPPSVDPHPNLPYTLVILSLSTGFGLVILLLFHGFRPSDFTAFHGFRPSDFTAFYGLRPSNLLLSTSFGLVIYCFPRASA